MLYFTNKLKMKPNKYLSFSMTCFSNSHLHFKNKTVIIYKKNNANATEKAKLFLGNVKKIIISISIMTSGFLLKTKFSLYDS